MRKTLVLLALLPILAAGTWWLSREAPPPLVPQASAHGPELDVPPAASAATAEQPPAPARTLTADLSEAAIPGVSGRVVDPLGNPVKDATVACTAQVALDQGLDDLRELARRSRQPLALGETTTDSQGLFRLVPRAERQSITVSVRVAGFQQLQRQVTWSSAAIDLGELTLQRGVVLAGRVVKPGGAPVAGASVWRTTRAQPLAALGLSELDDLGLDPDAVRTDAAGWFELAHEPPGAAVLRAAHPEHPRGELELDELAAGERRTELWISLEPGGTITGRVVNAPADQSVRVVANRVRDVPGATGVMGPLVGSLAAEAMEGLQGILGEREADLDANGEFVLRGLTLGQRYHLAGMPKGTGLVLASPCTERLEVAVPAQGIELHWDPGITVTFHAVDVRTGAGVERLQIRPVLTGSGSLAEFVGGAMSTRPFATYAEGRVSVRGLRPKTRQTLTLQVEAIGYSAFVREGIILPQHGTLDLGSVQLTPTPVVRVHVTKALDGTPIAGAVARVVAEQDAPRPGRRFSLSTRVTTGKDCNHQREAAAGFLGRDGTDTGTTDLDGWCVLNAPDSATFRVEVRHDEHAPHSSQSLTSQPQQDIEHRAALSAGGSVEVTALDSDGKPVAGASVRCQPSTGESEQEETDEQGRARFAHLTPGEHRFDLLPAQDEHGVRIQASLATDTTSQAEGSATVEVHEGQHASITLVLPPTGSLSGIVRENGVPLARARLTLVKAHSGQDPGAALSAKLEDRVGDMFGIGDQVRTDREGRYAIAKAATGPHQLRITHDERAMPALVPCEVRKGTNVLDVDLDLSSILGAVVGPDGAPVRGAAITVDYAPEQTEGQEDWSGMGGQIMSVVSGAFGMADTGAAKSDSDGSFELRGVHASVPLLIHARAKGLVPGTSARLEVAPGATVRDVKIQLLQAGRIQVRCESVKGPFAAVTATCESSKAEPVVAILRGGRALLEGLQPGRWSVTINGMDGGSGAAQTVDVQAGITHELRF